MGCARTRIESETVPAGARAAAAADDRRDEIGTHTHMAENPYAHTDRGMREYTAL